MSDTIRVVISRERTCWSALAPEIPGSQAFARNILRLKRDVTESIRLAAGLPVGMKLTLGFEFKLLDAELEAEVAQNQVERQQMKLAQKVITGRTESLARRMLVQYSVRDVGPILGMSPQRVAKIAPQRKQQGASRSLG